MIKPVITLKWYNTTDINHGPNINYVTRGLKKSSPLFSFTSIIGSHIINCLFFLICKSLGTKANAEWLCEFVFIERHSQDLRGKWMTEQKEWERDMTNDKANSGRESEWANRWMNRASWYDFTSNCVTAAKRTSPEGVVYLLL